MMIESFKLENFGPIQHMEAQNLGKVNLILAENSKGKTFILKALYSVIKSHEEAHKGKNNRSFQEELRDKLYWTFQVNKIGDLVSKGDVNDENKALKFKMILSDNSEILFSFGSRTEKEIKPEIYSLTIREDNSVFLPPKEVLSLYDPIKLLKINKLFGWDATYRDLLNALDIEFYNINKDTEQLNFEQLTFEQLSELRKQLEDQFNETNMRISIFENALSYVSKVGNDIDHNQEKDIRKAIEQDYNTISNILDQIEIIKIKISDKKKESNRKKGVLKNELTHRICSNLETLFEGSIKFDKVKKVWLYHKGNNKFSIHITAEGIKKIAILETLLQNGFLTSNSIIFIDEPESNLHPKAISQFLDILFELSQAGMQIFMATHSYFVIKKMHLLAQQHKESVPVLMSKDEDGKTIWIQENLIDGMPENEIINESIRLFEEELGIIPKNASWLEG